MLSRYLELAETAGGKADTAARAALGRAYLITTILRPSRFSPLSAADHRRSNEVLLSRHRVSKARRHPEGDRCLRIGAQAQSERGQHARSVDAAFFSRRPCSRTLTPTSRPRSRAQSSFDSYATTPTARRSGERVSRRRRRRQGVGPSGEGRRNQSKRRKRLVQLRARAVALEAISQGRDGVAKATTLAATNADAFAELGYVQESLKKYKEALVAYSKANELRPNPQLQEAIDRVKLAVGA